MLTIYSIGSSLQGYKQTETPVPGMGESKSVLKLSIETVNGGRWPEGYRCSLFPHEHAIAGAKEAR